MTTENWNEERDRLVELLEAIDSGKVTHVDQEHLSELQSANRENVQMLRKRLAELNGRLEDKEAYTPS
jgi:predicted nucleotidyltransferase